MQTLPRMASSSLLLSGSDYVDCGNFANLGISDAQPYTVEAWIYLNALGDTRTVFGSGASAGEGLWVYVDASGAVHSTRNADAAVSAARLATGAWNHVATTYDGQTLTLYLNGVADGSTPSGGELPPQTTAVLLGAMQAGAGLGSYFNGMVGQVMVWGECRTLEQVTDDSVQWEAFTAPALLALLDFTNIPARDLSGHDVPLAMHGARYRVSVPGLVLTGGYADVGNDPDLSLGGTDPYTIEGWIYPTDVTDGIIIGKFDRGVAGEYKVGVEDQRLASHRNVPPWVMSAPPVLATGRYYHFATTYDGQVLKLYIDGNLQVARYFGSIPAAADLPTLVGASYVQGQLAEFFQGQVQNVRIWSVALNEEQVRQWMYNDPVEDTTLVADFDFTVHPPVDNTGQHQVRLSATGAAVGFTGFDVDPASEDGQFGFLQTEVDENLGVVDLNPDSFTRMPAPVLGPQPVPFSPEHLEALRRDLRENVSGRLDEAGVQRAVEGLEAAFGRAAETVRVNPRLNSVSERRENGWVVLTHHTARGDVEIFRAPVDAVDPCTLWWINMIYMCSVGFFGALGLAPTPGNIAGKVFDLVSRNPTARAAIASLIGRAITVGTAMATVGVLWREGLLWPIMKLAFSSAGWWTLAWILKKAIAFVTGLEAATMLAGFITWAAQLTLLATRCPCGKTRSLEGVKLPGAPEPAAV